jgi:RNA polymerase sigma-70 factor (ECF subfamily)
MFNPALGYYIRRLLGKEHLAADVQQEIWFSVVRNLPRLKNPEAFAVWIYRIAHSKVMNHLLRGNSSLPLDENDDYAADEPEDFTPADAARIHAGLDQLSPIHREVLLLRFMEDLSYEQIAEIAGCSVGTVRSRLHNAKRDLRHILEKAYE